MDENQTQTQTFSRFAHQHRHAVENVVTLFEWLLVAFILALLFQGFAMQAFQIPTGSMAETLRGDHFPFRCTRCGFAFDVDSGMSINRAQCPNCDYILPPAAIGRMKHGDRIFVLKSIYQFFDPHRWDVVVFKNPLNPKDNFIKRLIALPGETVRLIQGDVYIDGQIMRKPVQVQRELWMPIYLQDYPICGGKQGASSAFVSDPNSSWQMGPSVSYLKADKHLRHYLIYQTSNPHDFRAVYSYNENDAAPGRPIVSDLMVSFYARMDNEDAIVGASLEKSGVLYSGYVEQRGAIVFEKTVNGQTQELRRMLVPDLAQEHAARFEFANVDRQLVLRWGDKRSVYDLTKDPDFAEPADETHSPQVRVFARTQAEIRHIALSRDIYYMGQEDFSPRATEDNPFQLKQGQFFVCGDNCNNSLDSRRWTEEGIGNNGTRYDQGIVPAEYMMGKAVMVYWSQALNPTLRMPPLVPNLNNLKIIYGGSGEEY